MDTLRAIINTLLPLPEVSFQAFASKFEIHPLKKGEYLVRQGEQSFSLGFLESGLVRSFYLDPSGHEYTKSFNTGPALVGAYSSLITRTPSMLSLGFGGLSSVPC